MNFAICNRTVCKSEKRRNQYLPTAKIICAKRTEKMQKIFLCGRDKKMMPLATKKMMLLRKNFFGKRIFFKLLNAKTIIC